ncbi:MAG: hypothetical protein J7647_14395 [Cyanobacteria bacterium SBLK]|nr:hypothetical protein [Cyanobacteria bacterium SBLK]
MPRIENQEWNVVSQLVFQIQHKTKEEAIDKLLIALLEKANSFNILDKEKWNLLLFSIQCLEFLIPSPQVTKKIVREHLSSLIEFCNHKTINVSNITLYNSIIETLEIGDSLNNTALENKESINSVFYNMIEERIDSENEKEICFLLEIDYENSIEYLSELKPNQFHRLCKDYFVICLVAVQNTKINLLDFIEFHGIEKSFKYFPYMISSSARRLGAATSLLFQILISDISVQKRTKKIVESLQIHEFIVSSSLPWICDLSQFDNYSNIFLKNLNNKKNLHELTKILNHSSIFGFYALLATMWETHESQERLEVLRDNFEFNLSLFIYSVFSSRLKYPEIETDRINDLFIQLNFTEEQKDFIWRWIRREINFVAKMEEEEEKAIALPPT